LYLKGIYVVQIYHNGIWRNVVLDGYFPEYSGDLKYGKCSTQLWAPLIEKAMAKLNEGYPNIVGGHMNESKIF
jgi:hypothetical protein